MLNLRNTIKIRWIFQPNILVYRSVCRFFLHLYIVYTFCSAFMGTYRFFSKRHGRYRGTFLFVAFSTCRTCSETSCRSARLQLFSSKLTQGHSYQTPTKTTKINVELFRTIFRPKILRPNYIYICVCVPILENFGNPLQVKGPSIVWEFVLFRFWGWELPTKFSPKGCEDRRPPQGLKTKWWIPGCKKMWKSQN